MIQFNAEKLKEELIYQTEPVIGIEKIVFSTDEKQWVQNLISASIYLKLIGLSNKSESIISSQEFLPLNITPNHIQPVFEVNKLFKFPKILNTSDSNIEEWKVEIVVSNLDFKQNESLNIYYKDQDYIRKRVEDWRQRIHELILQLSSWAKDYAGLEVRFSRRLPMHEGLMKDFKVSMQELDTADILKNGKIIISIKPFGLWILGANGRVDLLSAKGNYILIDEAEAFHPPQWKIFLKDNRTRGLQLDKEAFTQIVKA